MIHLGFSYIGLIWLLMLMIPNVVWAKNKPRDYDKYVKNENKILLFFERIGEGLCSVCCLIFSELNRPLFDVVYNADLYAEDMTYEVPAFFISGGCDYTCNFSLAESYCNDIEAPLKDCRIMEGHGHCPQYADPEGWAQIVKDMLSLC